MASTKVPDKDSSDEITQVTDQRSMYKKLEKLDGLLQRTIRHVGIIPEIKTKVYASSEKLIELNTIVVAMDERVDRVEQRIDHGHDCYQVDTISNVSESSKQIAATIHDYLESSIKASEKVKRIEDDVREIKGNRKWLIGVIIGLLVPMLGSIGSAIWLAATLNERVETQEAVRRQQIERVESVVRASDRRQTEALKGIDLQLEKTLTVVPDGKSAGIISRKAGKRVP